MLSLVAAWGRSQEDRLIKESVDPRTVSLTGFLFPGSWKVLGERSWNLEISLGLLEVEIMKGLFSWATLDAVVICRLHVPLCVELL